jgi:hypothetical protein
MGCFNPNSSDIDLLIIVKDKLTVRKKKDYIKKILEIEEKFPLCRIEFSILLEESVKNFIYPTPFELHFSRLHKERYQHNEDYICDGEDPDAAAHIVVTYFRGICLFGVPIKDLFTEIDERYYLRSIVGDIAKADHYIIDNPVYYVLNLCRVLYYLEESVISSKREGGEWAIQSLPAQYSKLIVSCLSEYEQSQDINDWDYVELRSFAGFMLYEINKKMYKLSI